MLFIFFDKGTYFIKPPLLSRCILDSHFKAHEQTDGFLAVNHGHL